VTGKIKFRGANYWTYLFCVRCQCGLWQHNCCVKIP